MEIRKVDGLIVEAEDKSELSSKNKKAIDSFVDAFAKSNIKLKQKSIEIEGNRVDVFFKSRFGDVSLDMVTIKALAKIKFDRMHIDEDGILLILGL